MKIKIGTAIRPLASDQRYTISMEYCGYEEPRYVARFMGEWLGQSQFYGSALVMCISHRAIRYGAEIITEKRV